jgi:hypothetical protein
MARFNFNLRLLGDYIPDPEGEDCRGLEDANQRAVEVVRQLAASRIGSAKPISECQLEITDRDGALLGIIPFLSVIK